MMPAFKYLLVDTPSDITWVTINRPDDRNSINSDLMEELTQLLETTEKTSTRAVVFTGAGETYFIGGADGIEMMQVDPDGAKEFFENLDSLPDWFVKIWFYIVASVLGVKKIGDYLPDVVSGVKDAFKGNDGRK